jgi:hypothetical protein
MSDALFKKAKTQKTIGIKTITPKLYINQNP